ncbi:unnamed protein product [Cuscuta epithymum]|uniref:CCHC-type domain-containing protein n=1 Tax=Cuscuta epithymum TaxID=186058 RepID=A0AAV0FJP7_9ASTE|nr:unnamed protein product [Cuscuta epithymum]
MNATPFVFDPGGTPAVCRFMEGEKLNSNKVVEGLARVIWSPQVVEEEDDMRKLRPRPELPPWRSCARWNGPSLHRLGQSFGSVTFTQISTADDASLRQMADGIRKGAVGIPQGSCNNTFDDRIRFRIEANGMEGGDNNGVEALAKAYDEMLDLEEEDEVLVVAPMAQNSAKHNLTLVGTITSEKSVRFSQFRDIMASVWKPEYGVTITEISSRRYVFQFYNEEDVIRVTDEGPWLFDQNLIVMSRLKEGDIPLSVPLNKAEFWIQVHDIPVGYFTIENAERIGNFLGTFIKADENNFSENWESFMRIRVCIDLGKPLKRKLVLQKEGVNFRVRFCYEKLPSFCFLCGVIGHAESHCPHMRRSQEVTGERPFGPWLRAIKGAKQWKENKWLVPAGKGSNSDNKARSVNSEEGARPGMMNGGLSSQERGYIEQKRRCVEASGDYQLGDEMELEHAGGKNGEEASYEPVARQAQH